MLAHPAALGGDWSDYFDSIEVVGNDSVRERPAHVVRLRKGALPSFTYWVDLEHGDVVRSKQIVIEGRIRIPVTVDYSDFEEFDGIRRAKRVEIENPMSGQTVLTFETFESGLELGDEVFTLEAPSATR